jgi:hypothetical protein
VELTIEQIRHYSRPLAGAHLPSTQLETLIQSESIVILHFLRHLGCVYCQYNVDQLHRLKQENPRFPTIYFVHQGDLERGNAFFDKHFPGAPHISDPQRELYQLFGILRISGWNLLHPKMILKGFQLMLKGYWNKIHRNDEMLLLSGTFLFYNGQLKWSHRARFAGDEPNWSKLG